MKKLATAILIWLTISTAYAAEKMNSAPHLQDTVNHDFKRVILTGNTIVYFVQSHTDQVTIDEGDPRDISITQIGNKLRISSSKTVPVIVTVYFKNIYRIEAFDQAVVRSAGKVNLINLQLMFNDEAEGRFKANTSSLYTVTNGQSKLELTGKTDRLISVGNPNLEMKNFTAKTSEEKSPVEMVARWESDYIR
ncbi:MAG: DUF2807 domain-containing protein [Pedobacter sp.]|uniref:GIN domain-containing protein n=1 Tax=Pedobacter sp. TaxID=1411316 RepID=UPI003399F99D